MTFFPEVTQPDDDDVSEPYVAPEWAAPPSGWLPGRIGISAVLASTDDVAVTISGLAVYRTGLQLEVHWLLRNRGQGRRDWGALMNRFEGGRWGPPVADPNRGIRFGVVLDDGTKAVTEPGLGFRHDIAETPEEASLVLAERGGSGDDSLYTTTAHLWAWPLPPDGRLEIVVSWPEFGITESRYVLDGLGLATASGQARPLWTD
ncbi:hypothetical protein ACPEEZ_07875 [Frigoribacterium sp. 2-23]|uniref:hypothetical protein n=1 Tax=Frigoribacterium sp. 2-23 TaxID=3415006 RepID=UPI003C6EA660